MKKTGLLFLIMFAACASTFGVTEFWFTRGLNQSGSSTKTNNRNYNNLANWSTSLPANPYYNTSQSKTLPTTNGKIRFAPNSGANGSSNVDNNNKYINLNADYSVGQLEVTAYGGVPSEFRGSEKTLTFNSIKVDNRSQVDIITKYVNSVPFTFYTNISIGNKSTGSATVTIFNSSDSPLNFSGDTITINGTDTTSPILQILSKMRQQGGTNAYQSGDINIESQIISNATIQLLAEEPSNANQAIGSIWLKGSKTNTGKFIASFSRVYLDKAPGAYAISSSSSSTDNQIFILQNRSYVCLMRDNQIDPKIELRFGIPITNRPDDVSLVSGYIDLNGYNLEVRNINLNKNDSGFSAKTGIVGVIDYGNGGNQVVKCQNFTYYSRYLNTGDSWVEFKNYKLGEDHFYCKTSIFTKSSGVPDTIRNKMLRFDGFGVFDVDYKINEVSVTVDGESYYEYIPQAL